MNRKFFGPNSCVVVSVVLRKSSTVAMNLSACLKKMVINLGNKLC